MRVMTELRNPQLLPRTSPKKTLVQHTNHWQYKASQSFFSSAGTSRGNSQTRRKRIQQHRHTAGLQVGACPEWDLRKQSRALRHSRSEPSSLSHRLQVGGNSRKQNNSSEPALGRAVCRMGPTQAASRHARQAGFFMATMLNSKTWSNHGVPIALLLRGISGNIWIHDH